LPEHAITITIAGRENPERLRGAIAADDDANVATRIENGALVIEIRANSLGGLRRAADDVLACIALAEGTLKLRQKPAK
jgi:hypothetical protein